MCQSRAGQYYNWADKDKNTKERSHTNKAHIYILNADAQIRAHTDQKQTPSVESLSPEPVCGISS